MRISGYWLRRQIAACLILFLTTPFGEAATAGSSQQTADASSAQAQPQNSTAGNNTQPAGSAAPPVPAPSQATDHNPQSGQTSPPPPPQKAPQPLGTAAAPYVKGVGVGASRPAGAAIAPAKQRRTRSFLINLGVVLGAAAAIGIVVALSKHSPSQPN